MNPSDYRREYAAFCSALERARHRLHAGHDSEPNLQPIFERYTDLWTREATESLRLAREETPAHLETERAALLALVGAARNLYAEAYARETSDELALCEASARMEWEGERVAAGDVPGRIEVESDAVRRSELAARWFDAIRSCDDLRAARLEAVRESARVLGFDDERRMRQETTGVEDEKVAAGADAFLQRTSSVYHRHLAQWASRELSPQLAAAPKYADSLFFRRMGQLDALFSRRKLQTVYAATMRGLGIRVETQSNIRIDDEARPLKRAGASSFGIDVPDEIYLVVNPQSTGARLYRDFFQQAGRAQVWAWASRDVAQRYPEFIYAPDGATREGHALLFGSLFQEAAWHAEQFGLRETEAKDAARTFALAEMYEIRLCCARLGYGLALRDAADARSEQLAETYATLHTEATGFRYEAATSLFDASEADGASVRLRASLFAAGLREYLRERYGRRWWNARGTGDELIDVWNTASRYRVEELARLIGAGELDFDLLADNLVATMNDE
ncbi:MAG TPA: hypothetical protein VF666_09745 [Pyrinomonadaceae bacterium]|jgi:hypothetical protein